MSILNLIASGATVLDFDDGDIIFSEGSPPDGNMYALLVGSVDIVKGSRTLETVAPGGVFGELALLDNLPRTACAISRGESRLAPISSEEFKEMVLRNPNLALDMMRVLSIRVRENLKFYGAN